MKNVISMIFAVGLTLVSLQAFGQDYSEDSSTGMNTPAYETVLQMVNSEQLSAQDMEPNNCVNPGGSCDGTIPCCDPYNHACFRQRCQLITEKR